MVLYPYKNNESIQQSSDADRIKDPLFPIAFLNSTWKTSDNVIVIFECIGWMNGWELQESILKVIYNYNFTNFRDSYPTPNIKRIF